MCVNCHRKIHFVNNDSTKKKNKELFFQFKTSNKCKICGYDECMDALDFHHRDPSLKDFEFRNIYQNKKCQTLKELENDIKKELDKCDILCANCHQEIHSDKDHFEKYKDDIYNWKYKEVKPPLNKEEVMKLYNEGMKQIDIAKKFGRNRTVICGIIKRYIAVGKEGSSV